MESKLRCICKHHHGRCTWWRLKRIDNFQGAYQEAFDVSKKEMQPTHPIYLGLALNFSAFYYETLNSSTLACTLAKTAFHQALKTHTQTAPSSRRCLGAASHYGHQTVREKNVLWPKEQKTNCIQRVLLLPRRNRCTHLHALFHLDFLKQRNPFMCIQSTVSGLLTLQLWESSSPWFVFVPAFLVRSYCCREW